MGNITDRARELFNKLKDEIMPMAHCPTSGYCGECKTKEQEALADIAFALQRVLDEAAERAVTWMQANIAKHNLSDQGLRAAIQGSEPQGVPCSAPDCGPCDGPDGVEPRPAPMGGEEKL